MFVRHAGQKTSKTSGERPHGIREVRKGGRRHFDPDRSGAVRRSDARRHRMEVDRDGRTIDPPKTAALYAPLQRKESSAGVGVERDVKYGPAELNRLDVFAPETAADTHPVLIFLRGGAFITGDKHMPG